MIFLRLLFDVVFIDNKMATTVVEFGVSDETVEFSRSSEDDTRHAKMFWQSMQLNPPMESRLVSEDITQRLKVAPPGRQSVTLHPRIESESPKLKVFLQNANIGDSREQIEKREKLNAFRMADINLLLKHRQIRIEKEKISAPHRNHGSKVKPTEATPRPEGSDVNIVNMESAEEASKQIALFESIHGKTNKCDSDSD